MCGCGNRNYELRIMNSMVKLITGLLLACVITSCHNEPDRIYDADKGITGLQKDDPTFLALKDTAQAYMQDFITSVELHSVDTHYYHIVKSEYAEMDTYEHYVGTGTRL